MTQKWSKTVIFYLILEYNYIYLLMCTVLLHHTDDYSTRLDRLCCALQFKTSRRITGADTGWISLSNLISRGEAWRSWFLEISGYLQCVWLPVCTTQKSGLFILNEVCIFYEPSREMQYLVSSCSFYISPELVNVLSNCNKPKSLVSI